MALPVLSVSPVRLRHIRQAGNVVTNPGFETNTIGWSTTAPAWFLNSGATLTRVTAQFRSGAAAGQIVSTAASAFQGAVFSLGVLPAGTYAFGAFLKGNAGGETVQLFAGHATAADEYINITLTTGWQPFSATFVANGTAICYVGTRTSSATVRTWFIDDVRVTAGQTVSDTAITTVLSASLAPQPATGINGQRGWQTGSIELVLSDEGEGTLTFPNTTGDDGVLHRRRFLILTDPDYHPGDEWIEVLQDNRVLFTGTPTSADKRRATISLTLSDGLWMLNTQRETAAGFWAHAPRDVFEHYTKAWQQLLTDDFVAGADPLRWASVNPPTNFAGFVRLAPAVSDNNDLSPTAAWRPVLQPATARAWRLDIEHQLTLGLSGFASFAMVGTDGGYARLLIGRAAAGGEYAQFDVLDDTAGLSDQQTVALPTRTAGVSQVAIEARDRWLFFYIAGQLVHAIEGNLANPGINYEPYITAENSASGGTVLDVHAVLLRECRPYLMRGADKGDYLLPGVLPSGGLKATYYDDADLRIYTDASEYFRRVLAPTRQPYARRQDATINHPVATPPTWQPATPPNGECFSVRWTGAIYLDLATDDITLRLTNLDEGGRVWIGKTLYGTQLIDSWISAGSRTVTSGGLRAHLGTSVSGWYPIRVDYAQGLGAGGIVLEWKLTAAGSYVVVPATSLSPYGIYEADVRYDSHAEQLKAIALAYGLQYRCVPRQLESGAFPGEVIPRVRVGRDTDKTLTPDESTDASVVVSADEVVDTILADAAGLSDRAGAAQLTSEVVNYPGVQTPLVADRHMMILTAYESLADITDPTLLQTRLASMLGLRTAPWEEVNARPRGHRELRDTFPLTGSIAAFAWEPGDGLRVKDPDLDLEDLTPRQLISVTWPIVPDGLGAPSVRFRQRPRGQQDALRALIRSVLLPQRNYQGQLVTTQGNWSSMDSDFTSVMLPANLADVVGCDLVVAFKSDASSWDIQNDTTAAVLGSFTTTSRIDMLPFLSRSAGSYGSVSQAFSVKVVGGTGTCYAALNLTVRI